LPTAGATLIDGRHTERRHRYGAQHQPVCGRLHDLVSPRAAIE
jgi:hypothetical protein